MPPNKTTKDFTKLLESFKSESEVSNFTNGYALYSLTVQCEKNFMKCSKALNSQVQLTSVNFNNEGGIYSALKRLSADTLKYKKQLNRDWDLIVQMMNTPFKIPTKRPISTIIPIDLLPTEPSTSGESCQSRSEDNDVQVLKTDCKKCPQLRSLNARLMKDMNELKKATKVEISQLKKNYNVKKIKRTLETSSATKMKLRLERLSLKKGIAMLQRQNKNLLHLSSQETVEEMKKLKQKSKDKDIELKKLKAAFENLKIKYSCMEKELKEQQFLVDQLESVVDERMERGNLCEETPSMDTKCGQQYLPSVRLCIYECLLCQVPVEKTSHLIHFIAQQLCNISLGPLPCMSTTAQCAYELSCISDVQVAELLYTNNVATICWDATSIEGTGVHVNECHVSAGDSQLTLQTAALAGGRTNDYVEQVFECLQTVGSTYAAYTGIDQHVILYKFQQVLQSTLSDRAAVNHCVNQELGKLLGKDLTELNCNLHPLDGLAVEARKTLSNYDKSLNIKSQVYGHEGLASNLARAVSKLRYKMKSGDPSGFKTFLHHENLKPGTIVRYVGNRMHVLFHLAGTIVELEEKLYTYLENYCCVSKLRLAILPDLKNPSIFIQLVVLGFYGKLLTGPWMDLFYSNKENRSHLDMTTFMKTCISNLKVCENNPSFILGEKDFFDRHLDLTDPTLQALKSKSDHPEFSKLVVLLSSSFIAVLERQLVRYVSGDLSQPTDSLKATTSSAPVHNIYAERVLGRFDSQCKRAPNARIGFIDAKVKCSANKTLSWLLKKDKRTQVRLIEFSVKQGQRIRSELEEREGKIEKEKLKRLQEVAKKKETAERRKVEKLVKDAMEKVEGIEECVFESLGAEEKELASLVISCNENVIGKSLIHVWDEDGENKQFLCKIKQFHKKNKRNQLIVNYANDEDDYTMPIAEFLTDIVMGDVLLTL